MTTLLEAINSRYQDTRSGITQPDSCANCRHCSAHLRIGYLLTGDNDDESTGYVCKYLSAKYNPEAADGLDKLFVLKLDRDVEVSICPSHIRVTCYKCKAPINHPASSMCPECEKKMCEAELDSEIVNVITGERLGTMREFIESGEI